MSDMTPQKQGVQSSIEEAQIMPPEPQMAKSNQASKKPENPLTTIALASKQKALVVNGGNESYLQIEVQNFGMLYLQNKSLAECTKESLIMAFVNAQALGLSFSGTAPEVYVYPFGKECKMFPSPYGYAKVAIRKKLIQGYTQPQIVYSGEDATIDYDQNGNQFVRHQITLDSVRSTRDIKDAVAVYLYLFTKMGKQLVYFTASDWENWKPIKGGGNTNATNSTAMLKAKAIKHAMKNLVGIESVFEEFTTRGIDLDTGEEIDSLEI